MQGGMTRRGLMCFVLVMLLVACGGGSAPTNTPVPAVGPTVAPTTAPTLAPTAAATTASGSATSRPAGTTAAGSAASGRVVAGVSPSVAVGGAVQSQMTLALADLQALPPVTLSAETRTRQGSQGSHQYTGVLLKDVLDKASLRPIPTARMTRSTASLLSLAAMAIGQHSPTVKSIQTLATSK